MKDEEIKKQVESLLGVTIDTDEKDMEEEVKEILNLGDEE